MTDSCVSTLLLETVALVGFCVMILGFSVMITITVIEYFKQMTRK